jgi:hypothetical protein
VGKELATMREKYRALCGVLDERGRRVWAAAEASYLPYHGVSLVAKVTGLLRRTIRTGIRDRQTGRRKLLEAERSRIAAGGREHLTFHNPDLLQALEKLSYLSGCRIPASEMAQLRPKTSGLPWRLELVLRQRQLTYTSYLCTVP